jgi:hypothetical protein
MAQKKINLKQNEPPQRINPKLKKNIKSIQFLTLESHPKSTK